MPSQALQKWLTDRAATLDDMETAHRSVRGTGPGARAAALQINQAYAMLLSAQFQGFCRELHVECTDMVIAVQPNSGLQYLVRINLLFGRKLDRGNPTPGNIGSDFSRFGLAFWGLVDAHRPQNPARKLALEKLNEWRNAIAHQDFPAQLLRLGRPNLALAQVQSWRRTCDGLAQTFDEVMRSHLLTLTGTNPW